MGSENSQNRNLKHEQFLAKVWGGVAIASWLFTLLTVIPNLADDELLEIPELAFSIEATKKWHDHRQNARRMVNPNLRRT